MINSPQIQTNQIKYTLPDDCDRASSIVGYDINNFVFGDDTFVNPQNNQMQNQNNVNKKANNPLTGALLLAGLGLAAFLGLKKGNVQLPKLPSFEKIGGNISKLLSNIKIKKP